MEVRENYEPFVLASKNMNEGWDVVFTFLIQTGGLRYVFLGIVHCKPMGFIYKPILYQKLNQAGLKRAGWYGYFHQMLSLVNIL